jgi:flagellin-specific chaperone FliS
MKRLDAYHQPAIRWTRIEMLLAAFDGVILCLEQVQGPLAQNERLKTQQLLTAQQLVLALYEGLDVRYGKVPENMQKLYLFVLNCIGMGPKLDLPSALKVLRTIRSGLDSIREQASAMERRGELSPATEEVQVLKHLIA